MLFHSYDSEWIPINADISQGSTLSSVLISFFIAVLLEMFEYAKDGIVDLGLVDDTNLIARGSSTAENCSSLDKAHDKCAEWGGRFGAKFAPDKHQVACFTKKR